MWKLFLPTNILVIHGQFKYKLFNSAKTRDLKHNNHNYYQEKYSIIKDSNKRFFACHIIHGNQVCI